MPVERLLQVTPEHASIRLDRFLAEALPELTRSQIKRLIDEDQISLQGSVVKAGLKLKGDESIAVVIPDPVEATASAEDLPLSILYEDSSLIVVDKPAHMVVHPAPGHQGGTLVNALLHHCDDLSGVGGELRPGIVHRLDKDTSGVMVATKNDTCHNHLSNQFKEHTIQRRYRALVHGHVQNSLGSINRAIGRHPTQRKKMSSSTRAGRRAVTHWEVLRRYDQDRLTLLDLTLETGRTHQIRVHLSETNLPVVGDVVYGNSRKARAIGDVELRKMIEQLDRQFLHAWLLGFIHPDGREMVFHAPLAPELQSVINYLEEKYGLDSSDLDIPSQP